jgi:hypothetical protein
MFNYDYVEPELLNGSDEEKKAVREEAARNLVCGSVSFIIKKILDTDKSGNPYLTKDGRPKIIMILELEDVEFNKADVFLHITQKMAFRIHQICNAVGKPELYEKNGFDTQKIVGEKGRCFVVGENGPYGYQLNITEFYLPGIDKGIPSVGDIQSAGKAAMNKIDDSFDDQIPF